MPDNTKLNRAYFIAKRDKKLASYLDELESAPVKRGWNPFLKQPIDSQRDITAACQRYLENLNAVCVSMKDSDGNHLKPIWEPAEEEDPGLQGQPAE